MDRRQRKTREAIFKAFANLLSKKDFNQITVGEIIDAADVGRATFYSHFETKDFLLKDFCEELFCHIFDIENDSGHEHKHIFDCEGTDSVFLHLFQHLQKNDNNVLLLLLSQNNDLFLKYFKLNLQILVERNLALFDSKKSKDIPLSYWKDHITSTFISTLQWWFDNGCKERAETITEYFFKVV